MGTYNIPRNVKGEGRILYIFSTKALMYTFFGAILGAVFYFIFKLIGLTFIGLIFILIFGVIGFSIATFKVPKIRMIDSLKDVSGENIDDAIKRYINFKKKSKKRYVLFTKEEK